MAVLPFVEGKALDIGCGENRLMKIYRSQGKDGIGVDVFPFNGVDMLVDTEKLPFADGEFDTVIMMASLNHIPVQKRTAVLREAARVLNNNGRLLITMINPFIGYLCHKLVWWDKDQNERGMKEGENFGLPNKYVIKTVSSAGFDLLFTKKFLYGLNNLFCFAKKRS